MSIARHADEPAAGNIAIAFADDNDVFVQADPTALSILIDNQVDNALKYNHEGRHVAVVMSHGDGRIVLHVEDNGPGIAREHRACMADCFFRLPGTAVEGSGLNLSIVARIVRR